MKILTTIKSAVNSTLKIAKVKGEIVVTDSFIEITVLTIEEATKLKTAFSKTFDEVDIFDLSEIDEEGYMINIRF